MRLPPLPFGNRTRMNSDSGGQLPPCQPAGDPGCPELKWERCQRWPEQVISQEGNDPWHVPDLRIEVVVLPIVDRLGPNPDSVRHIGLSKSQIDPPLAKVIAEGS